MWEVRLRFVLVLATTVATGCMSSMGTRAPLPLAPTAASPGSSALAIHGDAQFVSLRPDRGMVGDNDTLIGLPATPGVRFDHRTDGSLSFGFGVDGALPQGFGRFHVQLAPALDESGFAWIGEVAGTLLRLGRNAQDADPFAGEPESEISLEFRTLQQAGFVFSSGGGATWIGAMVDLGVINPSDGELEPVESLTDKPRFTIASGMQIGRVRRWRHGSMSAQGWMRVDPWPDSRVNVVCGLTIEAALATGD